MEKTKLSLGEALQLNQELNGVNGEGGILQEKLPFKVKYWLTKLAIKVDKEQETFNKVRNEIISKLGTKDAKTGNVSIPPTVTEGKGKAAKTTANPKFEEFRKEVLELTKQEIELEHAIFKLEDFEGISTDGVFPVFFELIKE